MKFLHTADLHLGKVLHERSLIEDQRHILDALIGILADTSFDALVIAGDVYDRSIPPPDAVRLFSPFLGQLKKARPDLEILLISGNHDSASRLGFGKELFAELGVRFVTEPEDAFTPIIIEKRGEKAAFFLLPFLNAGALKSEMTHAEGRDAVPLRSQSLMADEAAARLRIARQAAQENGADFAVLAAHLFTLGGAASASERTFLGGAELVNIHLFDGFDYIALGHLHKFQKAAQNAYYSGSPLAYSFSEAGSEKVFLSVMLEKGAAASIEKIPVIPLRNTTRLSGSFESFLSNDLPPDAEAARSDYLEITLNDTVPVENALPILNKRFPYLLSIDQSRAIQERLNLFKKNEDTEPKSGGGDIVDDFSLFLQEIYGEADSDELELFREILAESEIEA